MSQMDLIAAVAVLVVLVADRAVQIFAGHSLLSMDLEVALSAFFIAALARWRLSHTAALPEVKE